ncbi:hypothetical protein [Microbacterium sp. Clip185]|uniref:hypothetical protein n=1 Tax=Microbacterium sp. Clip185 TaxID=3025663 RepID=UPI0023654707|nr:hypothetical protein [Microbacterium sp. Clip185]WDG18028.1 hypothetical protein PQV94_15595 [Microbacterium sp. Clip185]
MELAVDYSPLVDPPFRDKNLKPDAQAIHAFAVTNGWEYYVGTGSQPLPGVLFRDERGTARHLQRAGNLVRIPGPPLIEIGNCAYSHTVNLNVFSVTWGYVACALTDPTPELVVETSNARRARELPALPVGAAQVALGDEGTAYVSAESVAWVQTVFDPRLVRLLNDPSLPFDVQISQGWLFLYCPAELSVTAPAVWQRTFAVLEAVRAAIASAAPLEVPSTDEKRIGRATASAPADPGSTPLVVRDRPAPLVIEDRSGRNTRRTAWRYYAAVVVVFLLGVIAVAAILPR